MKEQTENTTKNTDNDAPVKEATDENGARNGQRPARKPAPEAKYCPPCGLNLEAINAALGRIHGA